MSTTKEYKDFILEQLNILEDIFIRPMMGEYLLYYNGILFGGIYDNMLLLKITKTNKTLMDNPTEQIPYTNAKPMLLVDDLDDKEFLKKLITLTCNELPKKK